MGLRLWKTIADRRMESIGLSEREKDVARLVMNGRSNKEIAQAMGITEHTVKEHLRETFKKAEVRSRTALVVRILDITI